MYAQLMLSNILTTVYDKIIKMPSKSHENIPLS
jgi:hypothetical protein